jgi:membrane-bound metal-dependent hydrolase YbcI (DUF457 family)
MFVGHFALGFAAKRAAPRVSLAVLFAAAQLADLLWPLLVAAGVEQVRIDPGNTAFTPLDFISYPYSHSLLLLAAWGVVFAFVTVRLRSGTPYRTFAIVAALVVSHWLLDWITHRPDMPLYPGSARYGLGLWNSIPATLAIELAIFAAGVWIYAAATRARDRAGRWGFVAFVVFLLVVYLGNVFGSPPPSVTAISIVGAIGGAILLAWTWWFDSHRNLNAQGSSLS